MHSESLLFQKFWHLVCHRRELRQSGDYIRFDIGEMEVVIFNDNGEITAFDNKCPHRGSRIYTGDHGNQATSCGYHGWTYKNGRMIIPNREEFRKCDIDSANINAYKIDWCGDFVFVGINPEQSLYQQLGATAEILENISFNISGRHDFNRYQYECYWPLAIENALEPYHISLVHPETLALLKLEEGENSFEGFNSIWRAPLGDEKLNKKLAGLKRFFRIDYQYEGYLSIFMYPFSMLSSTFGYSYSLQNFFPTSDKNHTHFTSRLLTSNAASPSVEQILQPFFDSTSQVNRKVFEEDHGVCRNIPWNSWTSSPLKFPSKMEEKIDHFRELCRKFFH